MEVDTDAVATTDEKTRRLAQVPVLRQVLTGLDAFEVAALEDGVLWYGVPGGTTLFEQGEHERDVFVLLDGRLGVFVDKGLGRRLVHHSVPGEFIGEMALISNEPRTATVVALRDSEVLRIPAALADRLLAPSPPFMAFLLGQFSARLKTMTIGETRPMGVESVAVVPIGDDPIDDAAADEIARAFRALGGDVIVVDQRDAETGTLAAAGALRVDIARDRRVVWATRAIRQADRVLFVATAGSRPDSPAVAELAALARRTKPTDIMLVNPAGNAHAAGGRLWLGHFAPDQIFHVARGDAADHRRVARLVTGRAVGLVLAGGGARGFAHIGAMRALAEAGISADLICGTSMGALVGGTAAYDVDLDEVKRKVHDSFVLNRPIGDYTLPLVSLARGRRMSALFAKHFGDADIVDCWRTFFCVSTNLSTAKAQIHREGPLRRALRASSSLPGIVPPLVEGNDVLVDGGLMNNFPVDLMAALSRGRVIGIDIAAGTVFRADEPEIEARSLAWMLGPGRHKVPNILKLLMRSGLVASEPRCESNRRLADLLVRPDLGTIDLLSFNRYEEAIAAGYHGTLAALEALPVPFV
ncbi:patatin-like phospholipase family protein [uncultured Sphingomonas sp.]|uniref:patatin-like phospholipase family protein n=1 Tax=uncultured Sphingomonas sp. TaxID=158754 RepID=UPI0035CBAB1C